MLDPQLFILGLYLTENTVGLTYKYIFVGFFLCLTTKH